MTQSTIATKSSSRLLTAIRLLPATMLLAGALSFAPGVGATGCHVAPSNVNINGGVSRNAQWWRRQRGWRGRSRCRCERRAWRHG